MTTVALVRDAAPSTSLALMDTKNLEQQLALLEDPKRLELLQRLAGAYDKACRALLGPGDVQVDGKNKDGTPREFKKKSAWRKLGRYFGISTRILSESIEQLGEGEFIAKCVVRGTSPWGQEIDATGACGSDEEEGRRRITMADAVATAQTRAANRAVSDLVAMGEVSAEEIGERAERKERASTEPELTLEEALELDFPWRKHKKYGGKALGEVSTKTLLIIGEWAKQKLDEDPTSRFAKKLHRATVLIVESRPDLEQAIEERRAEIEKDDAASAGQPATSTDPRQLDVEQAIAQAANGAEAKGSTHSGHEAGASPSPAAVSADPNDQPVVQTGAPPAAAEVQRPDIRESPPPFDSGASDANGDEDDDDAPGGAGEFDAGPLVPELEEPATEETLAQLSARLIPLLDDARTPVDVRDQILARAGSGGLRTAADYKRAIGTLTLLHEIGA
ncbi:MAG: hypothetical protein ACJ768_19510 [Gaiellaceae bacterium]